MSRLTKTSTAFTKSSPQKAKPTKRPKRSREQQKRLAAFREFVRLQNEQWAKMTPRQQREAERKWELVKKSINDDRAGYRQVFVDD